MLTTTLPIQLPRALFALRLGVFIVMFMWTLDKLVNPLHATGIFANFYGIANLGDSIIYTVAVLELVLVLAFVAGLYKRWTYAAILLLHSVSTLSSWEYYLGFSNMLFFAAWPMLAACYTLYILRDHDSLFTIQRKAAASTHGD